MSHSMRHKNLVRALVVALVISLVALPSGAARATGLHSHPAVKTGGTVTVSFGPSGSWTRNFNPDATTGVTNGVQGFIYEPLLIYNMMKGGKIIKMLATGYKWGKGAKSLTFFLRKGVKWNDGQAFTSADLVAMWNLHKKYTAFNPCGGCSDSVKNVVAPNKFTVTYNFKQADSTMLFYLGEQYVIPAHIFTKVGDPTKYTNPNPVATGPFKLGSFSPQVFTLVKNKFYWQKGRPYVNALRFPAYTSNDSNQLALIKGEIDWGGVFIPDAQKTYASKSPNNHFWYPGAGTPVNLWLNNAEAPFNNVHVRRAISLAIDRTAISKVAEYGYEPAATMFVPGALQKKWGDPSTASAFPKTANVAKAKAELAKASGVDVSKPMKIQVVSGWSDWVTSVQMIADQLKQIGMNVSVDPLQFSQYLSNFQQGKFDLGISWSGGPLPINMMRDAFYSKNIMPTGTNWDRYKNSQMDKLINTYTKTSSLSKQIAIAKEMQKIVARDVPIMPIMYSANWYEYNTKRFAGWPTAKNPYISPAPWIVPEAEYVSLQIHPK